jgi:TonB-dependent receptor
MLKRILKTVFIVFFAGMMYSVSAQKEPSQKITGKLTDSITGESLVGVSVYIKGTQNGTTTNVNGEYTLNNVTKGQVLVFSFIGFETQEITVGTNQTINVSFKNTAQQIEGVVITAQAEGQKNAIRQQINSNTLKNVVASDRLQENPDANATEAIGRLPGISVVRSGGEGSSLVIRGLEPRYSSVTLNGMQLPSTDGSNRGSNISSISQYALQGAEVYKSLTADMEANSVAGTVNLKLRKAPNELHVNVMAQRGYNHLNNYWGNYKYLGEFSNRYFGNKLGVLFAANLERVNRSTQSMSAAYNIETGNPDDPIMLQAISLNDISTILTRRSALLSLDYEVTKNTTLMLYGMYTYSGNVTQNQAKNYGLSGAGSVGYNFSSNPNNETNMFQTAMSGETKFKFLKILAEYGVGYSMGKNVNDNGRTWDFQFDEASTSANTTPEIRQMYPAEVIPLFHDDPSNLSKCWLTTIGSKSSNITDENLNAYLNFTIPFKIGEQISGTIKAGGMHRTKNHLRDDQVGSQSMNSSANVLAPQITADSLDWIVKTSRDNISAIGISTDNTTDFLNGTYNFGTKFDFNRLNDISDNWENVSDFYYAQGAAVYLPIFSDGNKVGYAQDLAGCVMNDQNINESYYAGYLMTEINFGKYVMFLPGVRLENTRTTMSGFYAMPPQYSPNLKAPLTGQDTSAVRSDQYVLPMIHLRIKPISSFFVHLAYTQTLSRPDFNSISPNYFVNTGWAPFSYLSGNPELKNERWNNFDAQLTYHDNKLGLLSVTGFYKEVKDKIWQRSYARIKGDPTIPQFPDAALVNVTLWENHPYSAYVKGVEFDWQTSFSYLPKPFSSLTLSANYTYTHSETTYPYTTLYYITPPGGRPVQARLDSTVTGPMVYQPKHIANISLGFNKKGFNAWFSFQYNGKILTSKNYKGVPRLDYEKDYFYRYDLQVTQKFAIRKVKGFEVLANIANLSNFIETQKPSGDPRPTAAESYGWTADLGFRFRF